MKVTQKTRLQFWPHLSIITEDRSIFGTASVKHDRSAPIYIAQNPDRICHRSTFITSSQDFGDAVWQYYFIS